MKNLVPSSAFAVALLGTSLTDGLLMASPKCVPMRFAAGANGVTDAVTGLTWQRAIDARDFSWSQAKSYCAGLAGGWRLPSLLELLSIVDYGVSSPPTIDQTAFPDTPITSFWTSSPFAGNASNAWIVGFGDGQSYDTFAPSAGRVRCVR